MALYGYTPFYRNLAQQTSSMCGRFEPPKQTGLGHAHLAAYFRPEEREVLLRRTSSTNKNANGYSERGREWCASRTLFSTSVASKPPRRDRIPSFEEGPVSLRSR